MINRLYLQQIAREKCEKIATFRISNFFEKNVGQQDLLGIKNFYEEQDALSNLLRLAAYISLISQQTFLALSDKQLEQLHNAADTLFVFLQKMRLFHEGPLPEVADAYARSSIEQQLKTEKAGLTKVFYEAYQVFYEVANTLTTWTLPAEISLHAEAARAVETKLDNRVNELNVRLESQNLIAPYASTFETYAHNHKVSSEAWLQAGITLLCLTLAYSHFFLYDEIKQLIHDMAQVSSTITSPAPQTAIPAKTSESPHALFWSLILIRLFTLSLLGSLTFWTLRNYKLNKHNELLNRMKAISLRTFKDFSETTHHNEKVHDIVIRKIAETIFDSERFGYLTEDVSTPQISSSQFLDAILQTAKKEPK